MRLVIFGQFPCKLSFINKLVDTLAPQLVRARSNSESLKKQLASLQQQLAGLKVEKLAIEARFKGAKATGKIFDEMSGQILLWQMTPKAGWS